MDYIEINAITAKHFGTTPELLLTGRKGHDYRARSAAIHICRIVLNASYLKLMVWYNHRQHTTSMHSVKASARLIKSNREYRYCYKSAFMEAYNLDLKRNKKIKFKQMYNLVYFLTKKGIQVNTCNRTISLKGDNNPALKYSQLKKLIRIHNYKIQLCLL